MVSFDCYCALCSGPLNLSSISFGSRRPKALRKRREKVAKKLEAQLKRNTGKESILEDKNNDEEVDDADEADDEKEPEVPNPFAKPVEPSWGDTEDEDEDYEMEGDYEGSASSSDSESLRSTDSDFYPGGVADVRRCTPSPNLRTLRDPDCWSQWSELSIWDYFNPYNTKHNDNDAGSMDSFKENHAYDPEKLQADDVR